MISCRQLPAGWCFATVDQLVPTDAPAVYGIIQPGPDVADGVPYVRPTEMTADAIDASRCKRASREIAAKYSRSTLRTGDVVLSIVGTIGKVAITQPELDGANITQSAIRLRPGPALDGRYLAHSLRSPGLRAQFAAAEFGNAVRRLNVEDVRRLELALAPLNEQRRIVAKLEDLLARSRRAKEALDAIPSLLETLRRSILAAAFRGDLTADWRAKHPDVEPADRLLARTPSPGGKNSGRAAAVDVRPGRYAVSVGDPATPLPSGWSWVALSRIARMESGHTPSRAVGSYWGGEIPWVSIPDARDHNGRVLSLTSATITEEGLANSAARRLPPRTVCLVRTAASIGYVTILGREMTTSQDFANWICGPALLPEYLMYALLADRQALREWGEGSAHPTIYFPELKAFHVRLAPIDEQQAIVHTLNSRLAAVEQFRSLATEISERHGRLPSTLLATAFRGELVSQDPNDEPAEQLLARIRAEASAAPTKPRRSKPRIQPEG